VLDEMGDAANILGLETAADAHPDAEADAGHVGHSGRGNG
jgi:hypothetical protein